MNRYDEALLDKQMSRLSEPQNEGVIALMLAATFLVGVAIGSVLYNNAQRPGRASENERAEGVRRSESAWH